MTVTHNRAKFGHYWSLIKSLQTGLLLITGVAGFMSARCPVLRWSTLLGLAGSLFLAISGSTVLNMWYDRDLDALMKRTCWRPLPSGRIGSREALCLGAALSALGVGWALTIDRLYGSLVLAGLFFDVVVYTLWLKRRTAWSIVWGGIAGSMPTLAGRALGIGQIDGIGILLALAVLFWIPTHILTFNMRYQDDYRRADIPTFPSVYGLGVTRVLVAVSSVLAAMALALAVGQAGATGGIMHLLAVLSGGLVLLAVGSILRPSERSNLFLFKSASLYLLNGMLLLILGSVL